MHTVYAPITPKTLHYTLQCFQTAPINLTSNVILRVEGTMRAVADRTKFPVIDILPSVGHDYDTGGHARYHPFVYAVGGTNITVTGNGVIDGAGAYWWTRASRALNHGVGRPHLMELQSVEGVEVTGVTLLNSAFWTFHPIYCQDVHIHHMKIQVPWLAHVGNESISGFNGDGIDIDSCQNVLIEHNYINCGDDHFTVLAGVGDAGKKWAKAHWPCRNITIVDNTLGSGMGMSIGSSVSGGVEDVVYARNHMNETIGQWGMGVHIKTRTSYGGHIRNILYENNTFNNAGEPGGALHIESGYQSGHGNSCAYENCTDIRDITFRNLTFAHSGGTGNIVCFPARPCQNITFDNVHVHVNNRVDEPGWQCTNVASGTFKDVTPPRETKKSNCNFTI